MDYFKIVSIEFQTNSLISTIKFCDIHDSWETKIYYFVLDEMCFHLNLPKYPEYYRFSPRSKIIGPGGMTVK